MLRRRIEAADKGETPEAHLQLLCLLESPLLTSKDRGALLKKQRALAGKLHDLTDKQDQDDNIAGNRTSAPLTLARTRPERNLALLRAKMSLTVLRAAGLDIKGKLFVAEGEGKLKAPALTALEKTLHELWSKELVKQLREPKSPRVADTLSRIIPDWEPAGRAGAGEQDPSRRLQKQQRDDFFAWLQGRYGSEGRFLEASAADSQASTFYLDAARELRLLSSDPE
jgi:hypothetical protein